MAYPSSSQNQLQQQLSQPGDGNHFGTSGESSYSPGGGSTQASGVSASNGNQQPQHKFLQQHHNHFGQNSTFYPAQHSIAADASGNNNANTSANTDNLVFPEMQGSDTSVYTHTSSAAANTASNLNNFNAQPTLTDQFQQNVQAQHHNPVVSFPSQAQVNSSSFQSNTVLPSSFTSSSSNTHLQYNNNHNSLSFEEMTMANQGNIGHLEGPHDQFKPAEKMHVDEPVSGYTTNQGNHTQNISHFQQQNFQAKSNSMEIGFSGDNFSGANTGFSIEQFDSSLVDKSSPAAKDFNKVQTVDSNVTHNAASFELSNNQYQTQSVAGGFENSQFPNQTFAQDTSLTHQNQQLGMEEFQSQPSSHQNSSSLSLHSGQFVTQEHGQAQAASNQAQPGFGNNAEIAFQGTGYQETSSPVVNNGSPLTENFHAQASNIESPHTPTYNNQSQVQSGNTAVEGQQFQPHMSHQPSPGEQQQFKASPQSNTSDPALVLSPDYSSVGFQSNVASPENFGGQFSSQQQQHELQQQQQPGQHHQQNNFLNNVPPQQAPGLAPNDNFMTQAVSEVVAQQPQLATNTNLQYHSPPVNQGQVIDNSVKQPSVLENFAGSNNTQFPSQASFSTGADTFPQLDLESLASEEYNVKGVVAPDTVSQKNQNFSYQFSNAGSHTASQAVSEEAQANYSFGQNEKSVLPGTDSGSFETAGSGAVEQAPTFQNHPAEVNFGSIQNAGQGNQEKYPQPMQVQDNVFAKAQDSTGQLAFQAPTSRIGETAMDTSTGVVDKSQNLTAGMSYEEIHLSIVEAGNEFSRKAADAGNCSQQKAFPNPGVQQDTGCSVSSSSLNCHGSQTNLFFVDSSQMTKTEAVYNSHPQACSLTSSAMTSSTFDTQSDTSINQGKVSSDSSFSLPRDQQLFSSLLSNMQVSSTASGAQVSTQLSTQVFSQLGTNNTAPVVTMPNFLENPGVMLSCIHTSNPENVSMISPVNFNKPEQAGLVGTNNGQMVMTMIAASPINSLPAVAKSGIDHPKMAAIGSQQQMQQPILSLGSVVGLNPQLISSLVSFASSPNISSVSTVSQTQPQPQQHPATAGVFNQMKNPQNPAQVQHVQGLTLAGGNNDPVPSMSRPNGLVFQVMPSQADSKPPALTLGSKTNSSNPVIINQTAGSVLPAGTTAVVGGQQSMSQPHIVITLEDLKKLLTQKSSSLSPTSSESKPMEQPTPSPSAAPITSAPTLVNQSPAGPPLRLVQPMAQAPPRLFLQNPPRLMHPHEQLQQTREKLQQLVQQAQQSQTFPTCLPAHKNQERTILFASEESNNQKKVQTSIMAIQQDQQANRKMQIIQQMQVLEQQQQQHIQEQEQFHQQQQQQQEQQQHQQIQLSLKHTQDALQSMLFSKKDQVCSDSKLPPLQLPGSQPGQRLIIQQSQLMQVADQKMAQQSNQSPGVLNLGQVQQELQALKSVTASPKDQDKKPQQPTEKAEKSDRLCSDSLKKDYKHLHSLLTMDNSCGGPINRCPLPKGISR